MALLAQSLAHRTAERFTVLLVPPRTRLRITPTDAREMALMSCTVLQPLRDPAPRSVWTWSGELDAADVPALTKTWGHLLDDHPDSVVDLTVDLAAVTFLDCAILSLLVQANNYPGTRLALLSVPAIVAKLLQVTELAEYFTIAWMPLEAVEQP
ncbi:STAS domain-containing protein [Kineococcus sp. NBC_00420]|uniref:STAS domain-containing protein n=1 Tax=Kineococcus sp. NBC_00420 TaxID=2903564 RepID=UPI002E1B4752